MDSSNKKRKTIIISVLLFVLVVIAMAIAVWFFSSRNVSLGKYFEQYSNLLIFGKTVIEEKPGELSFNNVSSNGLENIYSIPRNGGSETMDSKQYHDEIETVLDKLGKAALNDGSLNDEDKSVLALLIEESKTLITYYFVGAALAYGNGAYNYYVENGNLDEYLSDYNYPFTSNEEEEGFIQGYGDLIDEVYDAQKIYYDSLKETGCIEEDGVDYTCDGSMSVSINDLRENLVELKNDLGIGLDNMLRFIINDADNMETLINGGGDEE